MKLRSFLLFVIAVSLNTSMEFAGQTPLPNVQQLEQKYETGRWKVQSVHLQSNSNSVQNSSNQLEWSILICTLPERAKSFNYITDKLKRQILALGLQDRIEILYFLDPRGYLPTGFKRNKLLQASKGLYTCFVDDDDDVSSQYIGMIHEKLQSLPDCVSLVGLITIDGKNQKKFIHSIQYDHFFETPEAYFRPPNHLNPIKREIAIQFPFLPVTIGEDTEWAMRIVNSHKLQKEANVNTPYYFYIYKSKK